MLNLSIFCELLFGLSSCFFWSLSCLSLFDLWLLIVPFVSSKLCSRFLFKMYGLYFLKLGFITQMESPIYMGYWCLMPLSTILQSYRFGQFYWWRKLEHQENITNQPEATKKPQTCGIKQSRVYLARGYRTHSFSGGRY
jgi:hypothetical protein